MIVKLENEMTEKFTDVGLFDVAEPSKSEEDAPKEVLSRSAREFEELYRTACSIQECCNDYVVSNVLSTKFMFKDNARFDFLTDDEKWHNNYTISDFALGQLCSKIGVPKNYIQKCLKKEPCLATENVNTWLDRYDGDFLIRTYKDNIRGLLSPMYSICDTPQILEAFAETGVAEDLVSRGTLINDERFHARFIMPDTKIESPLEKDLFCGICIDSSDVGRNILRVEFLVYKQVCTNGLILPQSTGTLFSQKHIGINAREFYTNLKESLKRLPEIATTATELILSAQKRKFSLDTPNDMLYWLSFLTERVKPLTEESAKRVLNIVKQGDYGEPTCWALINAITEESQNFTLDTRIDIENSASKLLLDTRSFVA